MKEETFLKRLSSLNLNKNSYVYKKLFLASSLFSISKKGKVLYRIRPVVVYGKGRYRHNCNHTSSFCACLAKMRISYYIGNDAPRGGNHGTFIDIIIQ